MMSDDDTTPTQADDPLTQDEAARLMRENDDLGPDSALPLRMIRQLVWDGKPLGQSMILMFRPPGDESLMFGAVTATQKGRVVFWPALPDGAEMPCDDIKNVDHITLELSNRRTHATGYTDDRKAMHGRRKAKLHDFPGSGLAAWFVLHVKLDVLRGQPQLAQRKMAVPPSDKKRRVDEVTRFMQEDLKLVPIKVPNGEGDCITAIVYLATAPADEVKFDGSVFPAESIAPEIDGWPNGEFTIERSRVAVGDQTLYVAAARPPGTLKRMEVGIGFFRPPAEAPDPSGKQ